ncbi:hypothetical protein SAMN05444358_110100 [Ruegeria halocynthiae]|uniref:Uncharacterized protein n=1 Tax=Ruegeria halocynthiae TaxID=985054 RepID=A0A1H3E887_9RHOB|nr:hypothetical protein SAMN05444358_110100 [Ruegeria halocynthiae]
MLMRSRVRQKVGRFGFGFIKKLLLIKVELKGGEWSLNKVLL